MIPLITLGQTIVLLTFAFLLLFALAVTFGEAIVGKDETVSKG